jgi:hypothetical protein
VSTVVSIYEDALGLKYMAYLKFVWVCLFRAYFFLNFYYLKGLPFTALRRTSFTPVREQSGAHFTSSKRRVDASQHLKGP